MTKRTRSVSHRGFTIMELLVVIVVIAILATISIVAYNGIQTRARNATLQSDLRNAATKLGIINATEGSYPVGSDVPSGLAVSLGTAFQYTSDGSSYCLTATTSVSGTGTFHVTNGGAVEEGACNGHTTGGAPPSSGWTAVAVGSGHTCGIKDGKAYCWGYNGNGQLGNGTTTNSSTPVAVNTTTMSGTVTAITVGYYYSCAVTVGGTYCWGHNNYGQLGNGTTISSSTPVAINPGSMTGAVTSISAGSYHTCAIASGKAYCWGYGALGRIGTGTTTNSSTPVAVNTTTMSGTVTAITTGDAHTCATTASGMYCWGLNNFGQLGNGVTTNSSTPVVVNSSTMSGTVTAIAAGDAHTCATTASGMYCWGYNSYGQIGNGSVSNSSTPVAVNTAVMSGAVTAITTGSYHTCAIAVGKVYCWGYNNYGQIGNGTTTNSSTPVAVTTTTMSGTVTAVTSAYYHTCATTASKMYCWGDNNYGQFGNGTTTGLSTPAEVSSVQ